MHPYKVVVWYRGSDKTDDNAAVLVEETVLAPSPDVAQLIAAWQVPDTYRDASKAAKLVISANFLA